MTGKKRENLLRGSFKVMQKGGGGGLSEGW